MAKSNISSFLHYYQRELSYLRDSGAQFAKQYPKIARRLELGPLQVADPHVERLIESFAYLTARLQKDVDDNFPRISSALLNILYPQFVNPLPSSTIMRFDIVADAGDLTGKAKVKKGSMLYASPREDVVCRFQTCYPVELWPLDVEDVNIIRTDSLGVSRNLIKTTRLLRLRIKGLSLPIQTLDLNKLRFYINGEKRIQFLIYEMLFAQQTDVAISIKDNGKDVVEKLPEGSLHAVGFSKDENIFPYSDYSHPAYRLFFEYFRFPEKFLFFDIKNLNVSNAENYFDILISVPDYFSIEDREINSENFLLGCTPAVNLFKKTSEPIKVDHKSVDYRLISDIRREKTTEIHSINKIKTVSNFIEEPQEISPYFSFSHDVKEKDQQLFWVGRRIPTGRNDLPGTDLYLSFVDFKFNKKTPLSRLIFAETLCTNRDLAEDVPARAKFQSDDIGFCSTIYCLDKPSMSIYPPEGAETQWRLISQLSLNHLSLSSGKESLNAIREIIRLYSTVEQTGKVQEVDGITDMQTSVVTRRIGIDAWRGFVQGTKIKLTFDDRFFTGTGTFLFGSILNNFFSLYAAVNSFTELEIYNKGKKGIWKKWLPIAGDKTLL